MDAAHARRLRIVAQLRKRVKGLRIGRSRAVVEALIPTVLEQKVQGVQARRSYARLVRSLGERAPGPVRLLLPPAPERVAALAGVLAAYALLLDGLGFVITTSLAMAVMLAAFTTRRRPLWAAVGVVGGVPGGVPAAPRRLGLCEPRPRPHRWCDARTRADPAMAALGRLRSLPEVAAARVGVLGRPEAEFHEHPGAGHAFDKLPV